jgi:predicted AAA+ superfamily ATPase
LRPWFRNTSKRLIKTPKLYFTDTGLLAYLLKYPDVKTILAGPHVGMLFENMIIMEFLKKKMNKRLSQDLYFYRDTNSVEVDLLICEGLSYSLYEIKSSKTVKSDMSKALKQVILSDSVKNTAETKKYLLSFYGSRIPLSDGVKALPWWEIG